MKAAGAFLALILFFSLSAARGETQGNNSGIANADGTGGAHGPIKINKLGGVGNDKFQKPEEKKKAPPKASPVQLKTTLGASMKSSAPPPEPEETEAEVVAPTAPAPCAMLWSFSLRCFSTEGTPSPKEWPDVLLPKCSELCGRAGIGYCEFTRGGGDVGMCRFWDVKTGCPGKNALRGQPLTGPGQVSGNCNYAPPIDAPMSF